jgi:hypothetical protein
MVITKCLIWVPPGEPVHSGSESVAAVWPHQRRMVRAAWMEKIMSKTDTLREGARVIEDSRQNRIV